jgi:hypothetical protein
VKALAIALVAAVAAACGSDHKAPSDAMADAAPPPTPDAPASATFTSYVIDLVKNQTSNATAPRPYSEFHTLPDPDVGNGSAYAPLFP